MTRRSPRPKTKGSSPTSPLGGLRPSTSRIVSDKPAHVQAMIPLGPDRTSHQDALRIDQYRTLQAVDRAVARLLDALEDTGRLDDALVIFTSDNGLLWGEHRWVKKEVPYEEAIRVPLVIRADRIASAAGADGPDTSSRTSISRRRSRRRPACRSRTQTGGVCSRCSKAGPTAGVTPC